MFYPLTCRCPYEEIDRSLLKILDSLWIYVFNRDFSLPELMTKMGDSSPGRAFYFSVIKNQDLLRDFCQQDLSEFFAPTCKTNREYRSNELDRARAISQGIRQYRKFILSWEERFQKTESELNEIDSKPQSEATQQTSETENKISSAKERLKKIRELFRQNAAEYFYVGTLPIIPVKTRTSAQQNLKRQMGAVVVDKTKLKKRSIWRRMVGVLYEYAVFLGTLGTVHSISLATGRCPFLFPHPKYKKRKNDTDSVIEYSFYKLSAG